MKKNIGKGIALYPMPLVLVGAMVDGRPNYTLVGHLGIMGHDHIMVSMVKAHKTNQGIRESKALTVAMVDEAMLPRADYMGCVSGNDIDKSQEFAYQPGETGAPIIQEASVVMECRVEDTYELGNFENFICAITAVHAEERVLDEQGRPDYRRLKPVLFEMPTYQYLRTGEVIGKCMTIRTE